MKKLYFIKEKTGKWNFCLVVNGKKIFNIRPSIIGQSIELTRQEFNKLFKK